MLFRGRESITQKLFGSKLLQSEQPNQLPLKKTGKLSILGAEGLLEDKKRQNLVSQCVQALQFFGFSKEQMDAYVWPLIENFAEFVQNLPETRNSYFSGQGGFIHHVLERTVKALTLYKQIYFSAGSTSDPKQTLWIYALFSGALLRGIGKVYSDMVVELYDKGERYLGRWNPFNGTMESQNGCFYDYDFEDTWQAELFHHLSVSFARQLMPKEGFLLLAADKEVFSVWLSLLEEDGRDTGTLGPILDRADAEVIRQYLENLDKYHQDSAKDSLNKNFISRFGLTFSPLDISLSGHEKMMKGDSNSAGIDFLKWVANELEAGRLMINKAPLLMVPGGFYMGPDMFKLFVEKHSGYGKASWEGVRESFLRLQLRTVDDKSNKGVILRNTQLILPSGSFKFVQPDGKVIFTTAKDLTKDAGRNLNKPLISENKLPAAALSEKIQNTKPTQPEPIGFGSRS